MILPDNLFIEVSVSESNTEIVFDIEEGIGSGVLPAYDGPYVITPRKVEQILETDNKRMRDDVTVEAISYIEASNPSGGYTATIGFE